MRSILSISSNIAFTLACAVVAIGQTIVRADPQTSQTNQVSRQSIGTAADVLAPYHGPVVKGVDTKTLTGKVMCGYQGWFGAPGDGSSRSEWRHWTKGRGPLADGNAKVDLWPDVSEMAASDRIPPVSKWRMALPPKSSVLSPNQPC
ncbi:MAG: hypothetical protein WDN00_16270 [Limisphaerales bacterium]